MENYGIGNKVLTNGYQLIQGYSLIEFERRNAYGIQTA